MGLMIIGILANTYGLRFPKMYYTIFLTTRNGLFMGSLLVAIVFLYLEGVLVSKYDSQITINMTFSTVMVAVVLVGLMISQLQMNVSKTVRNVSTLIYFIHPWIIFLVVLLEHFGIVLNASIKAIITMFISVLVAFVVAKMINIFKLLNEFM